MKCNIIHKERNIVLKAAVVVSCFNYIFWYLLVSYSWVILLWKQYFIIGWYYFLPADTLIRRSSFYYLHLFSARWYSYSKRYIYLKIACRDDGTFIRVLFLFVWSKMSWCYSYSGATTIRHSRVGSSQNFEIMTCFKALFWVFWFIGQECVFEKKVSGNQQTNGK